MGQPSQGCCDNKMGDGKVLQSTVSPHWRENWDIKSKLGIKIDSKSSRLDRKKRKNMFLIWKSALSYIRANTPTI